MAVIRTSRRTAGRSRAAVAALAAAGATLLAGCHAGQQAQTAEQAPTIDGNFAQVGDLALRDVTIAYPEDGSWPQGGDARVELVVVNEARQSDALVAVRSEVAGGAELSATPAGEATPTAGGQAQPTASPSGTPSASASGSPTPTATPTGSPSGTESPSGTASPTPSATPEETATSIAIPGPGLVAFREDGPEILLTGLTRLLRPGQVVPITFVFQEAGEVTIDVAVGIPEEEVELAPTVPPEAEGEAGAEAEE